MPATEPPDAWIERLCRERVLFDTMIVRYLCAAGAGDMLAEVFTGRLVWPEAVQAELALQSASVSPLGRLLGTRPATVLEASPSDEQEVEDIRIDMYTRAATRRSDTEHLGEAQCLFFAERDGYPLVTHDDKARQHARVSGVEIFDVIDVLCVCVRAGACKPRRAWKVYELSVASGLFSLPGYASPGARSRFMEMAGPLTAARLSEISPAGDT